MKQKRALQSLIPVILLLLLCALILPAQARADSVYGNLYYVVNGGEVTITDCKTSVSGKLTVPSRISGYPVTAIGDSAFSSCRDLTGITIPQSVTAIGAYAFEFCDSLTDVVIPDSVVSIGQKAFSCCYALTKLPIPDGVTVIEEGTFFSCDGLTDIFIPDSITTVEASAFRDCENLTNVLIGDSVTLIEEYAFWNCSNLTSVTIPSSIETVERNAFLSCENLRHAHYTGTLAQWYQVDKDGSYLPASIACRAAAATYTLTPCQTCSASGFYCSGCKRNVAPSAEGALGHRYSGGKCVRCGHDGSIDYYINDLGFTIADYGKKGAKLVLPHEIEGYAVTHIDENVFAGRTDLTWVELPKYLTTASCGLFENCISLKAVVAYSDFAYVDAYAFSGCTALKNVYFTGTYSQWWEELDIQSGNNPILDAKVYTGYVPTKITSQPSSVYVLGGKTVKFKVSATGKGLKYQWQYRESASGSWKNTTATGNKTATLTVTATAAKSGYQYRCVITDAFALKNYSSVVTLRAFGIATQPTNQFVPAGKTAKFTVKAGGSGLKYQWQYRTSATGKWNNATATGNKTASLKVPATVSKNGFQYRCKVTDQYGNQRYTSVATLKLVTLKVNTQPVNRYLPAGKTANLTVKATGTELKYQWQYRTSATGKWINATATGNKTTSVKIPVTASKNGYQYRCKITDKYGNEIFSKTVNLKVVTLKISAQPVNKTLTPGNTAVFTVKATGTKLTYQWQYRSSAGAKWQKSSATGSKTASLKIPVTKARNGYQYRCVITDTYGNVIYSNGAKLTVK